MCKNYFKSLYYSTHIITYLVKISCDFSIAETHKGFVLPAFRATVWPENICLVQLNIYFPIFLDIFLIVTMVWWLSIWIFSTKKCLNPWEIHLQCTFKAKFVKKFFNFSQASTSSVFPFLHLNLWFSKTGKFYWSMFFFSYSCAREVSFIFNYETCLLKCINTQNLAPNCK